MTGFARSQGRAESAAWSWELKTVNAKGFDLRLRIPLGLDPLEVEVRRMIGAVIGRGSVQVALDLARPDRVAAVRINEALVASLAVSLDRAARACGLQPPSIDGILSIKGVVEAVEADQDVAANERLAAAIKLSLEEAILALCDARQREGDSLEAILKEKIAAISALVDRGDALPSRGPEAVKARLRRQIAELFAAGADQLDPQRLHQEAMLIAVRSDIREELDRLKAHIAQVSELLHRGGAIGRRLDFLAQELSREANTLCAKSNDVALTAIGLDLKTLVEQFREQVQNVE